MDEQTAQSEAVERLTEALIYYRQNPPAISSRPAIHSIARRFMVHPKTLEQAVKMIARGECE